MSKHSTLVLILITIFCATLIGQEKNNKTEIKKQDQKKSKKKFIKTKRQPTNWFAKQRIFPHNEFNVDAFITAKQKARFLNLSTSLTRKQWEFVGPTNIGGRICDVEMDPRDQNVGYFASASGGVFKTTDQGKTWQPTFDEQPTLNTGDICLAPSDSNIVYVGTGEVNPGGGSITYPGMGVFKSVDAGKTWQHMGLERTQSIGRVKVHPTNPEIVYVAATGKLYGDSPERGVYRSLDGGKSWKKMLFVSPKTGCVDLAINTRNPNILYAAMWQRTRKPGYQKYGGPESGIYRSKDGGNTWNQLTNGLPKSDDDSGRIGIDICNSRPDVLYTCLATTGGAHRGVYKTTDGGDTWKRTNDGTLKSGVGTYAWWFSNIRVDPNDSNIVFFLGFNFYRSSNGGNSWNNVGRSMHVDHHGLYIHPLNSSLMIAGNDGGVYVSRNGGTRWEKSQELPITQFYSIAVDPNNPNRILAGAQDNGVNLGTGNKSGWRRVIGGDGLDVAFDFKNPKYAYGESQYGNFSVSTNGGSSFGWGGSGLKGTKGWKCPITIDPTNSEVYFGTNRVLRSTDHGASFRSISPDLTEGRGLADGTFGERAVFRTITAIAVAKNHIYAGTDNGNVWVSKNRGDNWEKISAKLPVHWITCIAVDAKNPEVAYVSVSGYRWDKAVPHILMTTNGGQSWKAIAANLPEAPINWIELDPSNSNTLYIASDVGAYMTNDQGKSWHPIGSGLPNVVIHELTYHLKTKKLYAATFGRGIYKIDVSGR